MTTWQLQGTSAQLRTPQLAATIDVLRPQRGVESIRFRARPEPSPNDAEMPPLPDAHLMQVALPAGAEVETVFECWTRANDLVAVYASTATRPSQPEIYWRAVSAADAHGLELIVSVHTGILDDDPSIRLTTVLAARSVAWWYAASSHFHHMDLDTARSFEGEQGRGACVMQLEPTLCYVEMIYPSDFCRVDLAYRPQGVRLQSSLFPERLEKGVIRRGRVRGWLLPSVPDAARLAQLYRDFAESDLPLTT